MMTGTAQMRAMTAREWLPFLREVVPHVPAMLAARRSARRRFAGELFPPPPSFPVRGDLTLFPIPRWLQPDNPLIDASCRFLGPTIDPDDRREELDPELAGHLAGSDPVVHVSLGTLHSGSDAFWLACFEALADLPVRVVLVVGAHTDAAGLGPAPANTLVRASVPQLEVLRKSAVSVTHGGMNSVLEGLHFGVPLVVVPHQIEQLAIGQRVADRGAATVLRHHLSHRPVPPARLRSEVGGALADPARRAAAETSGAALEEGGTALGAAAIQDFLATRTA